LDPADLTIVGEVDLRGNPADWRVAIPQFTQEQPGLLVEVQGDEKAPRPRSLYDIDHVGLLRRHVLLERRLTGWRRKIGNGGRRTRFQIRENLLDLTGERQLRVESGPVQIAAHQLEFP